MSFFEDDDEPIRASRTRPARPRQPAGAGGSTAVRRGGGGRPPGGGSGPDPIAQRRLVALGVGIVALVVLVLLVNGCVNSRKKNALESYNRDVADVITESDRNGADFFTIMNRASQGGDLDVRVRQVQLSAQELVQRAEGFSVRSEVQRAQNDLLLVLNLRAQGLAKIASKLPSALVQGRDQAQTAETAVRQIAGQMQVFLASDVIYSQRVAPYIQQALGDADVTGQRIRGSRFLPNLGWLDPNDVAGRLGSQRAEGGTGADPTPAKGLHGHELTSVTSNGVTLQPGQTVNRVPASPTPTFMVKIANQGDNDERQVVVELRVAGGPRTILRRKTIPQTTSKQSAQVSIPLGTAAPTTGAVTVTATVDKVPGEMNTTNNKQRYTVLFTR